MAENERKDENTGNSGGKSFDSAQDRRPKKLRVLEYAYEDELNKVSNYMPKGIAVQISVIASEAKQSYRRKVASSLRSSQ